MIYLFEDREKRKLEYLSKDFSHDNLRFAQFFLPKGTEPENYVRDNFGDAEVVIFHSSYDLKNCTIDDVRDAFNSMNISFVHFSGGIESGDYIIGSNDRYIIYVNSAIMYNNLKIFLDNYDKTKDIDTRILLLGMNVTQNEGLIFLKVSEIFLSNCSEIMSKEDLREFEFKVLDLYLESLEFSDLKKNLNSLIGSKNELNKSEILSEIEKIKTFIK